MTAHRQFVLHSVAERGLRFVRLWFVDVLGMLKSVSIPVSELESALEDGIGLDGSSLEGASRLREHDVIAHPDPQTFQVLPWRPDSIVGRMFCDVRQPDGAPFGPDSRAALRRVLEQAAALGYSMQVGCEVEFFLFAALGANGARPRTLDDGAYFDLTPLDVGSDFRRRTIDCLEQIGIPVKASHHEVAPSQHEIQLAHTDALTMADAITTFRVAVKEAAHELGAYATFMPKPLEEHPGSGMHLHVSLFCGERNAFHASDADEPLSETGRSFLAGVLAHACELTAVTNQWINSYRRLATGFEAPATVGWTRRGAAALVRVPSRRPGRADGTRFELRSPDPSCNSYLVLALLLAAGLRGIERGYELPAESLDEAGGGPALPLDLREATDLFDASQLARETLGDRLCDVFVANKRGELADERRTVTDFDRLRYLRKL
ncbi:MAG TPA: glutamine synthetase family protein [Solirubrobacteraceae bacterium]|jgi:glutamine synthetase|nr:glutamine synthetase family protein [Solirubrobacteraceae bacterium]